MRKELAALKAQLKERQKQCKTCTQWECGYCVIPKIELQEKIRALTLKENHT